MSGNQLIVGRVVSSWCSADGLSGIGPDLRKVKTWPVSIMEVDKTWRKTFARLMIVALLTGRRMPRR